MILSNFEAIKSRSSWSRQKKKRIIHFLNLSTAATLGTEESGRYGEVGCNMTPFFFREVPDMFIVPSSKCNPKFKNTDT